MTVACPPCQWPSVLEERGPPEDPAILLTGVARIGETAVQIVAIRINPTLRGTPDYRREVAEASYQVHGLDAVLETVLEELESLGAELGGLLGERRSRLVELATGKYRVGLVPASFDA